MSSRIASGQGARTVTVGSMWMSSLVLGSSFAVWGGTGCGETRSLEVFSGKPPPMMPPPEPPPEPLPEPCGELDKCPPDRKHCVEDTCVACVSDEHCTPGKAVCVEQACLECRSNEECPKEKVCHVELGRCTEPCSELAQCKDKDRGVCDLPRGLCVQCTETMGCAVSQVCDVVVGRCVACLNDGDCPDGGVCEVERQECSHQTPDEP